VIGDSLIIFKTEQKNRYKKILSKIFFQVKNLTNENFENKKIQEKFLFTKFVFFYIFCKIQFLIFRVENRNHYGVVQYEESFPRGT